MIILSKYIRINDPKLAVSIITLKLQFDMISKSPLWGKNKQNMNSLSQNLPLFGTFGCIETVRKGNKRTLTQNKNKCFFSVSMCVRSREIRYSLFQENVLCSSRIYVIWTRLSCQDFFFWTILWAFYQVNLLPC